MREPIGESRDTWGERAEGLNSGILRRKNGSRYLNSWVLRKEGDKALAFTIGSKGRGQILKPESEGGRA